jgi:hypothetical protein
MDRERTHYEPVDWPPLTDGPNEPGPTDRAGEYRVAEQLAPAQPNVGLGGKFGGARIPGEVSPTEQPIDVASQSKIPPPVEEDVLSAAERDVDDPRHIARGKPSMSSTEGSS